MATHHITAMKPTPPRRCPKCRDSEGWVPRFSDGKLTRCNHGTEAPAPPRDWMAKLEQDQEDN